MGWSAGAHVSQGEIIGKVATWGDFENGTSYHLHFNMQVMTKVGWVWVNPYMSLVLAYERMIGGRGTEIKPGDPPPVIPDKQPIILHPPVVPEAKPATPVPQAKPEVKAETKTQAAKAKPRKKRRHLRRKRTKHKTANE